MQDPGLISLDTKELLADEHKMQLKKEKARRIMWQSFVLLEAMTKLYSMCII